MKKAVDILREVHLGGGLRAIDSENDFVEIGLPGLDILAKMERPKYADLYKSLTGLGLPIVGVNFYQFQEQLEGVARPDWLARCSKASHWASRFRADSWANAKHALIRADRIEGALIAGKISEYLWLLEFRLLQLSRAYNRTLVDYVHSRRARSQGIGGFASNSWLLEVNAALHGFFADAGSAIDLLAEASCHFLEGAVGPIRKMSRLAKETGRLNSNLTKKVIEETKNGGWVYAINQIRNSIIHDQPFSERSDFEFFEVRAAKLHNGSYIYYLHYPLTDKSFCEPIRKKDYRHFKDETAAKGAMNEHLKFVKQSKDALETSQYFLSELCQCFEELHVEAHLESEPPTLTHEDVLEIHPLNETASD